MTSASHQRHDVSMVSASRRQRHNNQRHDVSVIMYELPETSFSWMDVAFFRRSLAIFLSSFTRHFNDSIRLFTVSTRTVVSCILSSTWSISLELYVRLLLQISLKMRAASQWDDIKRFGTHLDGITLQAKYIEIFIPIVNWWYSEVFRYDTRKWREDYSQFMSKVFFRKKMGKNDSKCKMKI